MRETLRSRWGLFTDESGLIAMVQQRQRLAQVAGGELPPVTVWVEIEHESDYAQAMALVELAQAWNMVIAHRRGARSEVAGEVRRMKGLSLRDTGVEPVATHIVVSISEGPQDMISLTGRVEALLDANGERALAGLFAAAARGCDTEDELLAVIRATVSTI